MESAVRSALGDLPVRRLWVRAIRPGRTAYIVVHAVLAPETPLDLTASDRLRGAIIAALAARHGPMLADVIFTAVEAYAAPIAGTIGMTGGLTGRSYARPAVAARYSATRRSMSSIGGKPG
jgi:hypothetical protein